MEPFWNTYRQQAPKNTKRDYSITHTVIGTDAEDRGEDTGPPQREMVRCAYRAGPRRRARCGDMVEHAQPQCGTAATPRKRTRTRRRHDVSSFLVIFGLLVVFRYLSFFLHQAPRQLAEALGREREPGCETPPANRKTQESIHHIQRASSAAWTAAGRRLA